MGEKKKLEFRDPTPEDGERYLVKSRAQLDLERRTQEEYKPESQVGSTVTVNPNPFGDEAYAGTDPIYQNYANEQNKPFRAKSGVEKKVEDQVREQYDLSDVDKDEVAEDYGLGGKARKAATGGPAPSRYLVPGQEGYEEQPQGGAVRSDRVASGGSSEGSGDGEVTEANNPGTNMGASTQPPAPPENPSDPGDKAGSKSK